MPPQATSPSPEQDHDRMDRVNGGLRILAAIATLSYPLLDGPGRAVGREQVFEAVLVFIGYSAILYALFWRPLVRRGSRATFYMIAASVDLFFTIYIIWLTGQSESPFFRALYLWVAMLSVFFGLKGGSVASFIAMGVLTAFLTQSTGSLDAWESLVKVGGLLMHGPLIGGLLDISRRRAQALERANRAYEEAHAQLMRERSHTLRLEKLTSMGVIASGLAHEINNPLQGAVGAVQALRRGTLPREKQAAYLEIVETALERVRGTVTTLLDYSRKGPVSVSRVPVRDAIAEAMALLEAVFDRAGVSVDNQAKASAAVLGVDRTRLQQALTNVLMNAMHATGEGGTVTISVRHRARQVGIHVVDDGPGIPAHLMDHVCDPFFTTKPAGVGTGLGLAISLRILEDHGGELEIRSPRGSGARVTLWLPDTREAP